MKNKANILVAMSANYLYNLDEDKFYYKDKLQEFTKKQFLLLKLLVANIGKYVNEEQIRAVIYEQKDCTDSTIRTLVKRIRAELKEDIILTNRGFGYMIRNIDFDNDKISGINELLFELEKQNYEHSLILLKIDNLSNIKSILGQKYSEAFFDKLISWLKDIYPDPMIVKFYKTKDDKLALLVKNNKELALCIANDIIEMGSSFYLSIDNMFISSKFSIGLYTGTNNGLSVFDHAVNMLEIAMSGKSKLVCGDSSTMYKNVKKNNIELFATFSESIYNDTPNPFFKPIINNKTGKIEKYECLANISDDETYHKFLEVASLMHSTPMLSKIIIRKAFEYLKNKPSHPEFFISLDAQALGDNTLFRYIDYWQEKTNINPDRIIFEIIQAVNLGRCNTFINTVKALKKRGYKIAIGDFGAGYSSLVGIINEGVDFIKIDCSFIERLEDNKKIFGIVSQIDKLIKICGAKSIAECVCNEKTQKLVQEIGIDYSQGYFIGKPTVRLSENKIDSKCVIM